MASEKVQKLLDAVKELTVLELNELVKACEEEFGVSAAAPVAVAAGPVAAAAEEQTEFTVTLDKVENKMGVIKAVKAALGISLIDAKGLVESAPSTLKEGLSKADADALIAAVKEAGGEASKK